MISCRYTSDMGVVTMSEYPSGMRRMRILVDVRGLERVSIVDVPTGWARWSDDARTGDLIA